jgi:hypothetical protein
MRFALRQVVFLTCFFLLGMVPTYAQESGKGKPRARDLGIPFDGTPGALNAITDGSDGYFAARKRIDEQFGVCGLVVAEWKWGDDRDHMGGGIGVSGRTGDDHEHAQRWRGPRRCDSLAGHARTARSYRLLVVAAGRGGDLGRMAERHQWISRKT